MGDCGSADHCRNSRRSGICVPQIWEALERGSFMDYENEVIIHTEGLSKSYGEKQAVCGLDLEIRRGEIFGLLGPMGLERRPQP